MYYILGLQGVIVFYVAKCVSRTNIAVILISVYVASFCFSQRITVFIMGCSLRLLSFTLVCKHACMRIAVDQWKFTHKSCDSTNPFALFLVMGITMVRQDVGWGLLRIWYWPSSLFHHISSQDLLYQYVYPITTLINFYFVMCTLIVLLSVVFRCPYLMNKFRRPPHRSVSTIDFNLIKKNQLDVSEHPVLAAAHFNVKCGSHNQILYSNQ